MSKTLCELKKALAEDPRWFMKRVTNATHLCTRCGRAANRKKLLCKPVKIKT
ncbi:MAG: hypothetical protein R3C99_10440 [Pirellulaceae bacterium]|nr:hypothetical protein [Planctomycetales bacterium]